MKKQCHKLRNLQLCPLYRPAVEGSCSEAITGPKDSFRGESTMRAKLTQMAGAQFTHPDPEISGLVDLLSGEPERRWKLFSPKLNNTA